MFYHMLAEECDYDKIGESLKYEESVRLWSNRRIGKIERNGESKKITPNKKIYYLVILGKGQETEGEGFLIS